MHKITFYEQFNSSLTIKSFLRPYRYTGCLKNSKSNGIANLLSKVFLIAVFLITVNAVPSDFLHLAVPLTHWPAVCLEVSSLHVLFRSSKGPCIFHKYLSC